MYTRSKTISIIMVALVLAVTPTIAGTASAASDPNTKVRAMQGTNSLDESNKGAFGVDIDCVAGIEGSGSADEVMCYLVPDGISTPNYASSPIPPQTSTTEGSCPGGVGFGGSYKCFTTTFDEALFGGGHWRFVAVYYNNGEIVDITGSNEWTNHSFFVLPEAPIGMIALLVSSLAVLGGYMFLNGRSHKQIPF